MIEIEIDGKSLQVEPGKMIIEVADNVGIIIPRFCYHHKLPIAANCRMCLVEVEKAPKSLPACATPVTAGMKIFTRSAKALESQRAVMEFLLINHPLDCPICDQGGECELQDMSLQYGSDVSRFTEGKRVVIDENLGSLIATDMTRCIHCTRCVRFGQEIAGIRELGATHRGEHMAIGTYVKEAMVSELSGNIIDLCPVGALTSKPFRFRARAWELKQAATIAPHDCLGSQVYAHSRQQKVMRVVPKSCEDINECWLSDRDRFSYLGMYTEDRLTHPMIKRQGQWETTDWSTALNLMVNNLNTVLGKYGSEQLAALSSANATVEELYLLQKMVRSLGSNHIDHRLQQSDCRDDALAPLFPGLNMAIAELQNQQAFLLVGTNLQHEQPLLAHRVRQATVQHGATVFCVNPIDYGFHFKVTEKQIVAPAQMPICLAGIAKALTQLTTAALSGVEMSLLAEIQPNAIEQRMAMQLQQTEQAVVLLGALAENHPEAAVLRSLSQLIARLSGAKFARLTVGANSAGAWLAGAIPHRGPQGKAVTEPGLNVQQALSAGLKAYLLLGIEPELDFAAAQTALTALQAAELVVAFSAYKTPALLEHAHILLPIALFAENEGTYVNAAGQWQTFASALPPADEAKPAWKVLRVLANLMHLSGFDYTTASDIIAELQTLAPAQPRATSQAWYPAQLALPAVADKLVRIGEYFIYVGDALVRRSEPLQATATQKAPGIYVNFATAQRMGLSAGEHARISQADKTLALPVFVDEAIADHCALVPAGFTQTSALNGLFTEIEVQRNG